MDQPGTVNKIKSKNFLIVTEKQKSLNFLYFMDQIGSVNKKKKIQIFFLIATKQKSPIFCYLIAWPAPLNKKKSKTFLYSLKKRNFSTLHKIHSSSPKAAKIFKYSFVNLSRKNLL